MAEFYLCLHESKIETFVPILWHLFMENPCFFSTSYRLTENEFGHTVTDFSATPVPTLTVLPSVRLQAAIVAENARHGDLVQGDFHDSYHNLTYKHIMALDWAVSFCPQAR